MSGARSVLSICCSRKEALTSMGYAGFATKFSRTILYSVGKQDAQ